MTKYRQNTVVHNTSTSSVLQADSYDNAILCHVWIILEQYASKIVQICQQMVKL